MKFELAKYLLNPKGVDAAGISISGAFEGRTFVRGYDLLKAMNGAVPGKLHRATISILKDAGVLVVAKASADLDGSLFRLDTSKHEEFFAQQRLAALVLADLGLNRQEEGTNTRIVATLPEDWERMDNIDPTDEAIRRIIVHAEKELWVVSPYFDDFGKAAIEQSLVGRAKNKVRIRVISRQLSRLDAERNRGSILALRRLVNEFERKKLANFVEIREFTSRDSRTGEMQAGLHSKIVIADRDLCYVGSANITEWCLIRNFELGVELSGPIVAPVRSLVERMWKESTPFRS